MIPIHLIQILLGSHVSAEAKGVRLKHVTCAHCGETYVYQLRRKAKAQAYLRSARLIEAYGKGEANDSRAN